MSRIRPPLALIALTVLCAGAAAQIVRKVPQDFPTIQEAVDASGNTDQIVISAGTYAESVVIEGLNFLNITCKGKVVIAPAAGPGLTLDSSPSCFIEKIRVLGGDPAGILLVDTSDSVFFKCRVDEAIGDGIRIEGGSNNQLIKCTVKNAGNDAVSLAGGSTNFTDGNLVTTCKLIQPGNDGVKVNGSLNNIDTCTVTKALGDGFELDDTTAGLSNRIQNGKAVHPGGAGLIVTGAGARIENMKFIGAGGNGAEVNAGTDARFTKCKFTKPGGNGLLCNAGAAQLTDSKITKPGGNGVWQKGDDAVISGNKVSGSGGSGFKIEGDDGSYVGNSATGAKGSGFDLTGATGNTLTENKAKGSKGFDLNDPVPADNDVDLTLNDFKTVGP